MKPNLGKVTGEILASTQPRPLAQHLGQKQRVVFFNSHHTKSGKNYEMIINHTRQLLGIRTVWEMCCLVCTSILFSDSWMVSWSKLWSRLSNVLLSSTRDSSLQTHPEWFIQMVLITLIVVYVCIHKQEMYLCGAWKQKWWVCIRSSVFTKLSLCTTLPIFGWLSDVSSLFSSFINVCMSMCTCKCTHKRCRLCLGVSRGGTEEGVRNPSGLPLTGLRTLLCTRQNDALYSVFVNTVYSICLLWQTWNKLLWLCQWLGFWHFWHLDYF